MPTEYEYQAESDRIDEFWDKEKKSRSSLKRSPSNIIDDWARKWRFDYDYYKVMIQDLKEMLKESPNA